MTNSVRYWAVIPAAGIGSRFGNGVSKQYAQLSGITVLERSVQTLLSNAQIEKIVIALHSDDVTAATLAGLQDARIQFVVGGATRADSVVCGLRALQSCAQSTDWVLVHDAARPCLRTEDLQKLIAVLRDDAVGGILAVPAIDTLKQVVHGAIAATVDRSVIWQAQTPQMFRFGLLQHCLLHAQQSRMEITDEASAVEADGHAVRVVEGSRSNIKITYAQDLALASFYLEQFYLEQTT